MVEDVMRDPQPVRHGARVGDIVTRAARTLAPRRGTIIVELQGDADHVGARLRRQRGDNRTVDPARHRDHDPALGGRARQIEQVRGLICVGEEGGVGHGDTRKPRI